MARAKTVKDIMKKLKSFWNVSTLDKLNTLDIVYSRVVTALWYKPQFGSIGPATWIQPPTLISNPRYIHIGKGTSIRKGVRLEVIHPHAHRTPELIIGDFVNIEQNVHIVCHSRVYIGSNVSITANCAIIDVAHPFQTEQGLPDKIGNTILDEDSFVEIGAGSFIGIGAVILPNVRIGQRAVIGANSVVTQDIPAFSVAAGVPAKVIRLYGSQRKP
jgi:acetyltransferase-like isoleucine patch superfamily enzyme